MHRFPELRHGFRRISDGKAESSPESELDAEFLDTVSERAARSLQG